MACFNIIFYMYTIFFEAFICIQIKILTYVLHACKNTCHNLMFKYLVFIEKLILRVGNFDNSKCWLYISGA